MSTHEYFASIPTDLNFRGHIACKPRFFRGKKFTDPKSHSRSPRGYFYLVSDGQIPGVYTDVAGCCRGQGNHPDPIWEKIKTSTSTSAKAWQYCRRHHAACQERNAELVSQLDPALNQAMAAENPVEGARTAPPAYATRSTRQNPATPPQTPVESTPTAPPAYATRSTRADAESAAGPLAHLAVVYAAHQSPSKSPLKHREKTEKKSTPAARFYALRETSMIYFNAKAAQAAVTKAGAKGLKIACSMAEAEQYLAEDKDEIAIDG
ncbi:hypothetical protein B0H10DRAFT_2428041 [Mycena sp. CBHHK59/15]|nr:hypothetical protein B0H10DRAFT_2428041 [Mycena sp. CBHHK59/15]